jgi:hypothetical protein
VVLGHVGDIGDAVKAAIPFERVSTTTYPNRRGIPFILMEEGMARCKKAVLELAHPNAAGIDIGSASHFVAVPADRDDEAVREFKSFTEDLNALADWLRCGDVDTVAMESAGVYWIPLFELLESRGFTVYLVNARHVKNVSGRKSDVLDCQWLQPLMSYGLLSGAFRPKDEICALRTVSRQRDMLLAYQARPVQPMQKALAQMNVQWANVSSDIVGETGQKIVRAIIAGERDGRVLARMKNVRIRTSRSPCAATGGRSTCLPCGRRWHGSMPTANSWPPVTASSKPCWLRYSRMTPANRASPSVAREHAMRRSSMSAPISSACAAST